MTILRLLADDLTGALDTAAELVPLTGAVPVFWSRVTPVQLAGNAALDSGTREGDEAAATATVRHLCRHLQGADVAFKKIDSLMRGSTLAEIAACLQTGIWRHAVLAPAFPFQDRVTRDGRQYARLDGAWTAVSDDLASALRAFGIAASRAMPGDALRPGVTVFDAETDDALRAIVAAGRQAAAPPLWIGTGGLAQAMAADCPQAPVPALPRPVLGLFGSDQAATTNQLAACGEHWLEIEADSFDPVTQRLERAELALVSFRLPPGLARDAAAAAIAGRIGTLLDRIDRPGTGIVAGGETLRSLCDAVGAEGLLVTGRLLPGVPRSVIQGGRWNGVTVISKSGAFGPPDLLRTLLLHERDTE